MPERLVDVADLDDSLVPGERLKRDRVRVRIA
jgi:hypothetical protein